MYCLAAVSGYIGSDVASGIIVSELDWAKKIMLFIDIGTNGEIVLSKDDIKMINYFLVLVPSVQFWKG